MQQSSRRSLHRHDVKQARVIFQTGEILRSRYLIWQSILVASFRPQQVTIIKCDTAVTTGNSSVTAKPKMKMT